MTHMVHLYIVAINLLQFLNNYPYILLHYTLISLQQCLQHYLLVFFAYAISKWSTILYYSFLLAIFAAASAADLSGTVIVSLI